MTARAVRGGAASGSPNARATRFAPAKLNLTLAVTDRRADGFHDLHSVFVPLGFGDQVEVRVEPGTNRDTLRIEGIAEVGTGSDNLVTLAVAAIRAAVAAGPSATVGLPPLAARLTKRIPVAAGMGGGSSDAAATIAAALQAWGATLPSKAVQAVAESLGSDVPFFLAGGPALVTGRGEFVDPLPPFRGEAPAVLVVTPALPVPTPAVFAAYAAGKRPSAEEAAATLAAGERLAADMRAGMTAATLLERATALATANDLLPAALAVAPQLGLFRGALGRLLGRPIGLSGSGSTCWILYPDRPACEEAAARIRRAAASGSLPIAQGEPFVLATTIEPARAHNWAPATPKGR
jgi:4-diphosphocytidyl-2-C-methyl-D-erythritol kinase